MCRRVQLRGALTVVGQPALELFLVCLARALLMLFEEQVETFQVNTQPALVRQFCSQSRRETKGLEEAEDHFARQHCLAPLTQALLELLKLAQPTRQGAAKALFLLRKFVHDVRLLLLQLGVDLPIASGDSLRYLSSEPGGHGEFMTREHCSPNQAAADVTPLDVRGDNTIRNQKGRRTQVIGNDALQALFLLRRKRCLVTLQLTDALHDWCEEISAVNVFSPVEDTEDAFQAKAHVDVTLLERLEGALRRFVVRHEDVVADLNIF